MRRLLCFIMLLALIGSARGQTAYSYRYWFDVGDTTIYSGSASGEATVELDIGSIKKGAMHALHIQAFDARNKWGAVHTSYFFYTRGGTTGATARYWFDSEEARQTAPTVNGTLDLDIESLGYGMHALHVQMFDADGYGSPVHTAYFYKGAEGSTARYWFDNEKTMQTVSTMNGIVELDVSGLGYGIHALHFQAFSVNGDASPVHTAYFYKGAEGSTARYWFDDEKTMQTVSTMNGIVELDVTALGYGIHALHFQAFSANGDASPVHTAYFYKGAEGSTARYWFDNEKTMQTVSIMNGLVELDVSGLGYGIHAVHFQAFSTSGDASPVHTAYFYKKEELDLSTVSCRLWIDDDESAAQTFALTDNIIMEAEDLSIGMHDLHVVLLNDIGMQLAETTAEFEVSDLTGVTLVPAFSKSDEAIYNLAGQRLSKLRIGINIRNGKKVLVK